MVRVKNGRGTSGPLQPGSYILTVYPWIAPLTTTPAVVLAGETTDIVVRVPHMVIRTVRYPSITRPESRCTVRWFAAGGREISRAILRLWQTDVVSDVEFKIAPGDYRVEVTDLLGRSVSKTFHIGQEGESDEILVLPSPFGP